MKIKIKNYTEKEKDIKIPSYWKTEAHTYKVFSDKAYDSAVSVSWQENINIISLETVFTNNDMIKEITEAKYKKALDRAIKNIQKL